MRRESPIYQQIIMHFEERIFDGRLPAAARIPSTNELAKSFNVNPETVQTALKRLMERGLVERRRGAGTFVRKGVQEKTVAIVFGENNFTRIDRAFFNILLTCLMRQLPEKGWNFRHFITTEKPEADAAFHELERAVENGSVRAIIEFCSNDMIRKWLDNASVPSAKCEPQIDYLALLERALKHLSGLGKRNIAVLAGKEHVALKDYQGIADKLIAAQELSEVSFSFAHEAQADGYNATMPLCATAHAVEPSTQFCKKGWRSQRTSH